MTTDAGIDYSGIGATCNRDAETGCRYGIIPAHDLSEWLWESVESVYTPSCPHCEQTLEDGWDNEESQAAATADMDEDAVDDLVDSVCPMCHKEIEDGEQWPDCAEPDANVIDSDGIKGFVDSQNDVWVTESKHYTYAQFCSPCAPGACYLRNALVDKAPSKEEEQREWGVRGMHRSLESNRCFCFPKDWFTDDKCPYPYWSVETGELVYSPE